MYDKKDRRGLTPEEEARERVEELKGFYSHFATYLVFCVFFVALDIFTGPGMWAIFPILGWGVGVAAHGVGVFGLGGLGSRDWEERKVRELLAQRGGLSPSDVRHVVHDELEHLRSAPADVDLAALVKRIENLETIATADPLPDPRLTLPDTPDEAAAAPHRLKNERAR